MLNGFVDVVVLVAIAADGVVLDVVVVVAVDVDPVLVCNPPPPPEGRENSKFQKF